MELFVDDGTSWEIGGIGVTMIQIYIDIQESDLGRDGLTVIQAFKDLDEGVGTLWPEARLLNLGEKEVLFKKAHEQTRVG